MIDKYRNSDELIQFARGNISANICDVSAAITNMGSSMRLFLKHFDNFKINNADLHSRLQVLIDSCEYINAADLCHSVKGLAGMLALNDLYTHLIELELALKNAAASGAATGAATDASGSETAASGVSAEALYDDLDRIRNDMQEVCKIQF